MRKVFRKFGKQGVEYVSAGGSNTQLSKVELLRDDISRNLDSISEKGLEELREQIAAKIESSKKSQLSKEALKELNKQSIQPSIPNDKSQGTRSIITRSEKTVSHASTYISKLEERLNEEREARSKLEEELKELRSTIEKLCGNKI
eukprot:TRINITY_DN10607_c0_g1_i1.p1 TRINITY_DN10607_c0_g1~~TRINITY_DN10607_c0_g1_i1.p1  ORF type:complete len:146 (+),score=32.87 TRINITY_DN10607_c0_g1_i1:547-984(+)